MSKSTRIVTPSFRKLSVVDQILVLHSRQREWEMADDFREIGLKALQWYVRWERRDDWRDSDGEVSLLCELAAKELKG